MIARILTAGAIVVGMMAGAAIATPKPGDTTTRETTGPMDPQPGVTNRAPAGQLGPTPQPAPAPPTPAPLAQPSPPATAPPANDPAATPGVARPIPPQ